MWHRSNAECKFCNLRSKLRIDYSFLYFSNSLFNFINKCFLQSFSNCVLIKDTNFLSSADNLNFSNFLQSFKISISFFVFKIYFISKTHYFFNPFQNTINIRQKVALKLCKRQWHIRGCDSDNRRVQA